MPRWINLFYSSTITVRVESDHIQQGQPNSPEFCPLALSLQGIGFTDVHVYKSGAEFRQDENTFSVVWLADVAELIANYDKGMGMEPVGFDICIHRKQSGNGLKILQQR